MTDLTNEVTEGRAVVAGAPKSNPYIWSSPAWLGWEAGYALRGLSGVKSARMSRGFSVRVETRHNTTIRVAFDGKKLDKVTIDRRD